MTSSIPAVVQEKEFLQFFAKQKPDKRRRLIAQLQRPQLNSLSEVFSNLLRGNLGGKGTRIITLLRPYRNSIRKLTLKSTSLKEKKKILSSKRGGNILGLILPVVAKLLKNILL